MIETKLIQPCNLFIGEDVAVDSPKNGRSRSTGKNLIESIFEPLLDTILRKHWDISHYKTLSRVHFLWKCINKVAVFFPVLCCGNSKCVELL